MELAYSSPEMKAFKKASRHWHSYGGGQIEVWGDGSRVLRIAHPSKSNPLGIACVLGPDGQNEWGERFAYGDYFLPEELGK
jgi:hypothetical protein